VATEISVNKKERADKFTLSFSGYINIAEDGIYEFMLDSDDGSRLSIDEQSIAVNYGPKSRPSGGIALKKGLHKLNLDYFDSGGDNYLKLYINKFGAQRTLVSPALLFHQ
jgi:hypothetical protein